MGRSVIIIGAGAAGLQAGRRLSAAGHSVTLLEAAAIPGGRILTLSPGGPGGFSVTAEGGAEFIHGELPLSLGLARAAGVGLVPVEGQMVRIKGGEEHRFMTSGWDELFDRMKMLSADMPFADFLSTYFSDDRYAGLRDSAGRMAEGYDLADLRKASTLSLYREWSAEEDGEVEYRPAGGYRPLIDYLVEQCRRQGCILHLGAAVSVVRWQRGGVVVETVSGGVFRAEQLVVTVSLGVLKAGVIRFLPGLPPARQQSIDLLGYGSVIKVLLEFDQPFWRKQKKQGHTLFVLSDERVPTWWTQSEDDSPLITGWVSGERMHAFRALDKKARIDSALQSLAAIFGVELGFLRRGLRASLVLDWQASPSVLGGYSYDTVGAADARRVLGEPLEGTLFFAGEGLYEGDVPGTVEAAFCSGVTVADKIIAQS